MKVLVTGGTGMVGKSLEQLIGSDTTNTYVFLSSKDCDLRNEQAVDQVFSSGNYHSVIHLAAKVGGLYNNLENNYQMLVDNIKINTNILECCKKYKIKRLTNVLSTCVFGNDLVYPLTSDQMHTKEPDSSNLGYATAKRLLDTGSKLLATCSDIEIVNIIPTNLWGNDDNYNIQHGHILPAIIHKCFLAKQNSTSLLIKGNGSGRRQFVCSKDLSRIILHFTNCNLPTQFNQLIVGPPKKDELTIKELIHKVVKEMDYEGEIVYDTSFSNGQHKKTVSDSELLAYIPDFKFTPLDIELKNTIQYFTENYQIVRK